MRWRCERCKTEFDDPATEEGRRGAAAEYYGVAPEELDQEDVEMHGCHGCGYMSWLVPVEESTRTEAQVPG
jgi:hypothetical protein